MAVVSFPARNLLAYPTGRAPGFDPNHVAALKCPFSGVATYGGTFGHVLSRVKGTEGGSKTSSIYGSLGPITNYPAGGAGTENTIFPFLAAASAPVTLAGIFKKTATPAAATQYLLNNAAGGAVGIGDINADGTFGGFHEIAGTDPITTGVTYVLERPYFFAMSFSLTFVNWVVRRLDSGQLFSGHVANATGTIDAGDGNITVGSRSGANRQFDGGVAAAMASNAFMSQQALQQWARDPWAFWYPPQANSRFAGLFYLRPDADSIDGGWTNELGGTVLFSSIDEVTADDADYIQSSVNPSADIAKISLSNPATSVGSPVKLRYRYKKSASATANLTVRLLQGVTEIASFTHSDISSSFVTTEQTLTAPQLASITDFTDLYIEVTASS